MPDRRSFLSVLGSSLSGIVAGAFAPRALVAGGALQVVAEPTVFWANPDGSRNLVRFSVSGIDAPAGRLRVYDGARRLLGTAGMLRAGDALQGELWMPLERATSVTSELEAPGIRGPFRTSHRLSPSQQWTVVWLTVAAPEDLARALAGLSSINHAVQTAVWREAGVIANPLAAAWRLHQLDHLPFLRGDDSANLLKRSAGIHTASAALIDDVDGFPATTPMGLRGSGIRYVIRRNGVAPFAWWPAPDGSRILAVTLPTGADPDALGFADPLDTMAARVSAHLGLLTSDRALTFVAQTSVHDRIPRMVTAVQEWNRRYAYPRILLGGTDDLAAITADLPETESHMTLSPSAVPAMAPAVPMAARLAEERATAMRSRGDATLRPLADLLAGGDRHGDPGRRLAAVIDTRVDGILITNPSPFRRTDVVTLPDGRRQTVTDVPALGYAFVLDEGVAPRANVADPAAARLDGSALVLRLDAETGAIRSLRDRAGREWAGVGGFNAIDGAVIVSLEHLEYPGLATEFVARRYSTHLGAFISRITAWHAFPWIDIENHVDATVRQEFGCRFDAALSNRSFRWEVPAGHQETAEEVPSLTHLRWLALEGDEGSLLLRGLDTPLVDARPSGSIEFRAAKGVARYRLHVAADRPSVADCTRFGWNAEPFVPTPVSSNVGGTAPRFGNAVVLDQTDAAVIGIETSVDGASMKVFLQNLTPESRFLTLGYGLLAWTTAHRIDLQGREIAPVTEVPDGLAVQVPGWGVAAVRLAGMRRR